ncbi:MULTISPECIES: hypothetical protein [unclassified Curtobacterium]|uniref:hypothetical protein n=1 Tax=unclassified Curtobacterium TaxID=257496 RepID=UPI00226B4852|nr:MULTISPECIES: hypothetical protein [unclassified Curtobacterium]
MAQRNRNNKGIGDTVKRGWNSKPAAIGAIVVVALVVIVVLLSTLLGVFAPAKNDGQGTTSKAAPTQSAAAAAGGPCNVRVMDRSTTPRIPADLTWKTGKEGLTWPVSKSVGPTKTISGFNACFARSPLGAALAAQNAIYSQYDTNHGVTAALNFYIADSKGKAANVEGTAKSSDASQVRAAGMNPAGFTVDSFTKNRADVTLVYSNPSTSTGYVGIACSVQWVDDDWKLSVLDNGELSSGNPTTPSEGDFISWGGNTQ